MEFKPICTTMEKDGKNLFSPDPKIQLNCIKDKVSPSRKDFSFGFALENFFSEKECEHYIKETEKIGYKSMEKEYPKEYRNCERICLLSSELSSLIWERLKMFLNEKDVKDKKPMDFYSEGIWKPKEVNPCLKFSKYYQGQKFKPHVDGLWSPNENEVTIHTILIYLNDNFEGGNTNFIKAPKTKDVLLSFLDPKQKYEVYDTFKPKKGSALIFSGDLLHEGEVITNGVKYLIRTELIFEKASITKDIKEFDEKFIKMEEFYEYTAKLMLKEESPIKITQNYLSALNLQYEESLKTSKVNIIESNDIPEEIIMQICLYLFPKGIVRLKLVNQHWYKSILSSELWRQLFKRNHESHYERNMIGESKLINWYKVYKYHTLIEKKNPLIIDLGNQIYYQRFSDKKFNSSLYPQYSRSTGWRRKVKIPPFGSKDGSYCFIKNGEFSKHYVQDGMEMFTRFLLKTEPIYHIIIAEPPYFVWDEDSDLRDIIKKSIKSVDKNIKVLFVNSALLVLHSIGKSSGMVVLFHDTWGKFIVGFIENEILFEMETNESQVLNDILKCYQENEDDEFKNIVVSSSINLKEKIEENFGKLFKVHQSNKPNYDTIIGGFQYVTTRHYDQNMFENGK